MEPTVPFPLAREGRREPGRIGGRGVRGGVRSPLSYDIAMPAKSKIRTEFGDFQTPDNLAREVCRSLSFSPRSLVEPTCGVGSFLHAALDAFPLVERAIGHDINAAYIRETSARLSAAQRKRATLATRSFFETDWAKLIAELPEPILVLGNPPWVTSAGLGVLGSGNLPEKKNAQKLRGLDARTGKSNFDISEWMLLRLLEALQGRDAQLAMLCKTSVARKVLLHAWKSGLRIENAAIFEIDAMKHFNAAAGACLLRAGPFRKCETTARIFPALDAASPASELGFRDGALVADLGAYEKWRGILTFGTASSDVRPNIARAANGRLPVAHKRIVSRAHKNSPNKGKADRSSSIAGRSTDMFQASSINVCHGSSTDMCHGQPAVGCPCEAPTTIRTRDKSLAAWRSGIKHDCARVMEFTRENEGYVNGLGETVTLEDECLYPLLKSSDLAHGRKPHRYLLVTQRSVGEDTARLKTRAPKTWKYLQCHADALDRRASSIYRGRPPFSIFGVGPYTFAPWKIAISGLYKTLRFSVVGSFAGKPVVMDDTCYFFPCKSHATAKAICEALNSPQAAEALGSLIFWDAKRPITVDLLSRVNVAALERFASGIHTRAKL